MPVRDGVAAARGRTNRILVLALLLALAGCGTWPAASPGGAGPARPAGQPPAATTPTVVPQRGGRATIGVVGDLRALNPAFAPTGLAAALFRPVVEGLFDFDAAGRPRAWLAESVPAPGRGLSADGLVAIVRLRQGVAWEDGRPFTADDVLFTLAASRNPDNLFAPEVAAAYRAIRAADALDPYTVRLTLAAPGDGYLRAFAPVFPAHLFNGQTNLVAHPYARAPFGTGPFRFAEWLPGERLTLTRSPSYRLGARPYLDAIEFRAFPDRAAAEAAERAGDIDLLLAPDGGAFAAPPADSPIQGLDPRPQAPPTWNAGDWWRDEHAP